VRHNASASICKTLGDKDRALALAIIEAIEAGDEVLKKNQTLNISALAPIVFNCLANYRHRARIRYHG